MKKAFMVFGIITFYAGIILLTAWLEIKQDGIGFTIGGLTGYFTYYLRLKFRKVKK